MKKKYGICLLSVVPLRETISHSSQMTSELLLGELFSIEEKFGHWFRIVCNADSYSAWVDSKQVYLLDKSEYTRLKNAKTYFIGSNFANIQHRGNIFVGMGSMLPGYNKETSSFEVDGMQLSLSPTAVYEANPKDVAKNIEEVAYTWLNTPYLWGGKSFFGTDCSGFVQTIYRMNGIYLKRDAKDQFGEGKKVNELRDAKAGNLLFFSNEQGDIVHVGIYLGNNRIIHCSGKVRIDSVDKEGIFMEELGGYSHKLCGIRNVI